MSHLSGIHTKDQFSSSSTAIPDVETPRVATLSTIFNGLGESYILRRLLLKCIASDSSIADVLEF
jgi:hypothetical protein